MKKTVLSIIFASLITATSVMMFSGCGNKETSTPDEATTTVATSAEMTTSPTTSTVPTTVPKTTVPKAVKDLVDKGEIKVDKDGNITDKNGKKVEVKDGKVEVKTDDGKTVTVKVDDVKTTVSNKNNSNKGNIEKKEETSKTNTSSSKADTKKDEPKEDKKPTKKPSGSSNTPKPAEQHKTNPPKATEAPRPTEKPKQKVWVDDYKTVHHEGYWKVVGTKEEPVYGWVGYNVCNDCGMKLADANSIREHLTWEVRENGGRGSYHYEEEYVQTGTKTVEKKEWVKPYDEKVKDGGHWEYK